MSSFEELVTTVGFPIAAYLLVYLDLRIQVKKLTEAVDNLAKRL